MNIYFRQCYIEPGVWFLFNHFFQKRLSSEVTALVVPSPKYIAKYGEDFDLIFNPPNHHRLRYCHLRSDSKTTINHLDRLRRASAV
jgi:hypothetical protein